MQALRLFPLAAAALSCMAFAQTRLYTLTGPPARTSFGSSMVWLGDLNGDGSDDFGIGGSGPYNRHVEVHSGTDGRLLFTFEAASSAIVRGFDHDGDGIPEVLSAETKSVRVSSGRDGSRLLTIPAPWQYPSWSFGISVAPAGDTDADGVQDVVVGDLDGPAPAHEAGACYVFSGATGAILHRVTGTLEHESLGRVVAPAGDVNGDGYADFATNGGPGSGSVLVFSGRDGSRLRTHAAAGFSIELEGADMDADGRLDLVVRTVTDVQYYAAANPVRVRLADFTSLSCKSMGILDDLDGDGIRDLALGFPAAGLGYAGSVAVVNTGTGRLRFSFQGTAAYQTIGESLAGGGDANGDGVGDLLVGNNGPTVLGGYGFDEVHVHSMSKLLLAADVHEVSLSASTAQTMTLDAGPAHAGHIYWMAGSLLGTHPGTPWRGFLLPLNVGGPYFTASVGGQAPMLIGGLGYLDASGRGQATFKMPAGYPQSLAGLTVHHAYFVYDTSFRPVAVSNAVPVTLRW